MHYPKPNLTLAKKLNIAAWIATVVVLGLVFGMHYLSLPFELDVSILPKINAILNSIAGVFLLLALYFIKKGDYRLHSKMIYCAVFFSICFLGCYVLYHITTEPTRFCKDGMIRTIYFVLLATHIISAALSFPFILFTFIRGFTFQVNKHKKMARWVFPVWLYVVVTGPICYLLLAPCY